MRFEHPELIEADDTSVVLLGFYERGRGPPQRHRPVLPVRHPSRLLSHAGVSAVDDVRRAEALPEPRR